MCGFAGIVSRKDLSNEILLQMGRKIEYRGPNSTGVEIVQVEKNNIGLVHKRLSIIDLSNAGSQPMWNDSKNVCMVFNGEIYNYKEIREELRSLHNVSFKSDSDSEVILVLYDIYGINFLDKLNGMFSIVLLDKKRHKLYLIRDRIGVKPLYYGWNNDMFFFGSELKTFYGHNDFKPELNNDAIRSFLQYGYVPTHLCIYNKIKKVKPGNFVEYDLKSNETISKQYWNLSTATTKRKINDIKQAKEEYVKLFESAFNYRMVADVPVGIFLSGGYDSTLLTGILSKKNNNLRTFTIGFTDKKSDESKHAKQIARHFNTEHHEFICGIDEALNYISKLPVLYDEPFGDPSAIPTMMVSEKASKFVKVVLSADGGDEIFAGYNKHLWALKIFKLSKSFYAPILKLGIKVLSTLPEKIFSNLLGLRNAKGKLIKISKLLAYNDLVDILRVISQYIPDSEINSWIKIGDKDDGLFKNKLKSGNILDDMLFCDIKTHLPDQIMTKVDRATMFASIEGREPLLDHRIIEKSFSIDNELKISKTKQTKYLIKSIVWDMIPKKMIERPKHGFGIPLIEWMQGPLKPLIDDLISEESLSEEIFNIAFVLDFKERFYSGEKVNERKLWHVLMFQLWYREWITNRI
tara:strand:- start:8170 stop:10071 length:1902 start_codon:yes stop_codon:yes gene_type:complete